MILYECWLDEFRWDWKRIKGFASVGVANIYANCNIKVYYIIFKMNDGNYFGALGLLRYIRVEFVEG